MKSKDLPTYGLGMKQLEEAVSILKETSLPREPYAAAKYLLLFAESELRKGFKNQEYTDGLEDLVEAIQTITVYL
jgi:hypothetical protein